MLKLNIPVNDCINTKPTPSMSWTAKVFHTDRKNVRRWLNSKDELFQQKRTSVRRTLSSKGTKHALYPEVEDILYAWFERVSIKLAKIVFIWLT